MMHIKKKRDDLHSFANAVRDFGVTYYNFDTVVVGIGLFGNVSSLFCPHTSLKIYRIRDWINLCRYISGVHIFFESLHLYFPFGLRP